MNREDFEAEVRAVIEKAARERRADPFAFVCEVIEPLRDTPVDGFLLIWRSTSTSYRWNADDAIHCFERVIADPPADLIERIRDVSGFVLNHVAPDKITPYSREDYVAWLRDLLARMRVIYDETAPTEE